MSDTLRSKIIRLAASMPKGSIERTAMLEILADRSTGHVVFHAETPRGATVVRAYKEEDGGFYWEETERGRGTFPSPVASGHMSSAQNLVLTLNNHFRAYRDFDPRTFKVISNDIGVRV